MTLLVPRAARVARVARVRVDAPERVGEAVDGDSGFVATPQHIDMV
ncbi:hypothetical protein BKA03_001058 [Demequina lutea]|uniref:Uncharacterized protein n=1 Tax=Demequina lutea TaxID=431489 RepID=A0A7Y9Z8V5_9MICO|nr:hypothetical protein [Demequina lutea]